MTADSCSINWVPSNVSEKRLRNCVQRTEWYVHFLLLEAAYSINTAVAHDELVSIRLQTPDATVRDSARLLEVAVASQNE